MKPNDLLALARTDFSCYGLAQWPRLQLAPHHKIIIDTLEAIDRGEIRRAMFFLPPRHGKTLFGTMLFPAWYSGRHPERSIITTSYGQDLADDYGRSVRNLVSSPIHQAIFPECRLSSDATGMRHFTTTLGGSYYAIGLGGPINGRGAHLLLIDDPIKDYEQARSEVARHSLKEWYTNVGYTRLQPDAAVVLIQTRWHEDDLAGWLLREHGSENWTVISQAAIAEKDETFRNAGEALWPQRFSLDMLEQIRVAIGGKAWASLYQQRPSAADGSIYKRNWWRFYREPPVCRRIIQSWDTAFKTGQANDYSACTTWGMTEYGFYLLSFWRDRVEFPELKKRMQWLAQEWKPNVIVIEDAASGQSLIQEMQRMTALPIIPVKVDKDKESRARAVTPLIEAGKVFLPESAPGINDFVDEFAAFPNGTHDDWVDSTTLALNYERFRQINTIGFFTVHM